jgi:hypothetical protein
MKCKRDALVDGQKLERSIQSVTLSEDGRSVILSALRPIEDGDDAWPDAARAQVFATAVGDDGMEPCSDALRIAEPGETAPCVEQCFLGHVSGFRFADDRCRGTVHLVYPRTHEYLEGRRHAGGVSPVMRHRCVHSSIDPRRRRFVRSGRDLLDAGASAREAMTTLKTATSPVRCPAETTADLKITISIT